MASLGVSRAVLNITELLIRAVDHGIKANFQALFGSRKRAQRRLAAATSRQALQQISGSNARYHDVEHTLLVVHTGLHLMLGRRLHADLSPQRW